MFEDSTDSVLLEGARTDRDAFAALFDRHARAVYLYAWGQTRNNRDAEDLTQEVFVTAWTRLRRIRIVDSSALPWLLVTCRNLFRNHRRREFRRSSIPLNDELGEYAQSIDHSEALAELTWVRAEIENLSGIDQRLCELCLIEGQTYSQAGATVGLSPSAVAKRIERARGRLRSAVRGEE